MCRTFAYINITLTYIHSHRPHTYNFIPSTGSESKQYRNKERKRKKKTRELLALRSHPNAAFHWALKLVFPSRKSGCSIADFRVSHLETQHFRLQWNDISYWKLVNMSFRAQWNAAKLPHTHTHVPVRIVG